MAAAKKPMDETQEISFDDIEAELILDQRALVVLEAKDVLSPQRHNEVVAALRLALSVREVDEFIATSLLVERDVMHGTNTGASVGVLVQLINRARKELRKRIATVAAMLQHARENTRRTA